MKQTAPPPPRGGPADVAPRGIGTGWHETAQHGNVEAVTTTGNTDQPDDTTVLANLKNWAHILGGIGAHADHTQTIGDDRVVRCDCGDHVPTPVPGQWRGQ